MKSTNSPDMTPQPPAQDAELLDAMSNWCKSLAHNAPLRRVLECAADRIAALTAENMKLRNWINAAEQAAGKLQRGKDAAERKLAQAMPLIRSVVRTVDAWNNDPHKVMDHPFTRLANEARAALSDMDKGQG